MSTLAEHLAYGRHQLQEAQVENGAHDAWLLLEFVCKIDRSYYFLHEEEELSADQREMYMQLIQKRKKKVPLQQLTNEAYFYGMQFYVNEHVLIPRQDTECLVEEVCKRGKNAKLILDMCTGSGCILVSILHTLKGCTGTGVDISGEALRVAEKNAAKFATEAEFIQSDLFERVSGSYDIIVSNPPYIKTDVIKELMAEVRDHEPVLALDGRADGLYFYRKIIKSASAYLNKNGWLCFEIGYDQGDAVKSFLREAGYKKIEIIKDLAGHDRVAAGQWI